MPNKKSQSSIEFIIIFGFILFFFSVFILVINMNMINKTKEQQNLRIKELALTVQNEINLALESGHGYYREFIVPSTINNQAYTINIQEDMVYIKTLDNKYAIALPVPEITGNIQIGTNIIRKDEGEIKLNV